MQPAEARRIGLRARRSILKRQRRQYSRRICSHLQQHAWFRRARVIGVYQAQSDEVDLEWLQHDARLMRKVVVSPRTLAKGVMRMVPIGHRFRRGRYGIAEPVDDMRFAQQRYSPQRIDLLCVPLSAFDAQFARVGMGGGFYDRWLAKRSKRHVCRVVGVAFSAQQVDAIVSAAWDERVDSIVTEFGFSRPA
ncbi:MAG: 5-formyltetrahydrofolate cyclo-ligase [Pseudomonadota bacterium]